jgi:hypothetical protein
LAGSSAELSSNTPLICQRGVVKRYGAALSNTIRKIPISRTPPARSPSPPPSPTAMWELLTGRRFVREGARAAGAAELAADRIHRSPRGGWGLLWPGSRIPAGRFHQPADAGGSPGTRGGAAASGVRRRPPSSHAVGGRAGCGRAGSRVNLHSTHDRAFASIGCALASVGSFSSRGGRRWLKAG